MKARNFENNDSRLTYTIETDVHCDGGADAWQAIDTDAGSHFNTIGDARDVLTMLIEQANADADDAGSIRWRIMERTEHPVTISGSGVDSDVQDLRGSDSPDEEFPADHYFCRAECSRTYAGRFCFMACTCNTCEGVDIACYCSGCNAPAPEAPAPAEDAQPATECTCKAWIRVSTQVRQAGVDWDKLDKATLSLYRILQHHPVSGRIEPSSVCECSGGQQIGPDAAPEAPAPEAPAPAEEKPQLMVCAGGSVSKLDKHGQPTTCVANISLKDDGRKMLSVGFGAESQPTGINVACVWHKPAELEATILAAIAGVSA